jgi:hypothetical protein
LSFARLSPRYWALATFFIPIAGTIAYGVWIVVTAAGLAHSTQAEELVRTGALVIMSAIFLLLRRPWARAIGIASAVALVLMLIGVIQFDWFRGA